MLKDLKKEAKKGQYASISEFIRFLIRDYQERRLAKELNKIDKEFDKGEFIEAESFLNLQIKNS